MPHDSPVSRRSALRLGMMGTAIAFGHPLFVAQARAQDEPPPDDPRPLWTAVFAIEGCPVSSANVLSFSVDRLDFDLSGGGKPAGSLTGRAVIGLADVVEIRKEVESWLQESVKRKRRRTIEIVLAHRDGGKRSYTLQDAYPTRFSHVDFATEGDAGGAVMAYKVEVRVDRVEMA